MGQQINVIALTPGGAQLARRLAKKLSNVQLWLHPRDINIEEGAHCSPANGTNTWHPSFKNTIYDLFKQKQSIVFIGALGILVRLLAPMLQHKSVDPAVVAVDEQGRFAISVLSGHWGGANNLTNLVAESIGAQPVITTATDVVGHFAIDVWAKKWQCLPEPWDGVKTVNSAILRSEPILFFADSAYFRQMPEEARHDMPWEECLQEDADFGQKEQQTVVWLTPFLKEAVVHLFLRPKCLVAGIGCRRGVPLSHLEGVLEEACQRAKVSPHSLAAITTVERKLDEIGLQELAKKKQVPLWGYPTTLIKKLLEQHPEVVGSDFVEKTIGVKAVCQPTVMLSHPSAKVILPKTSFDSVTISLALVAWPLWDWDRATGIK